PSRPHPLCECGAVRRDSTAPPPEIGITHSAAPHGPRQYRPCCLICARAPVYNIPHDRLTEGEKTAAAFLRGAQPRQCKRCRAWGPTEIHHWAPRALFADRACWPASDLGHRWHLDWRQTRAAAAARKGGTILEKGLAPEAEEFPEVDVGPPTACPDIRGLADDDAAEAMVEWFRQNFEDPAESTPYEGGYVYICGGPYAAREAPQ